MIQTRIDRFNFRGAYAPPVVGSRQGAWCSLIVKTDGSPSVASASGGSMDLSLAVNSEAESAQLYMGDILPYDIDDLVRVEFIAKITGVGANTIAALGLISATNATLDSIAQNAMFRLEGNNNLLLETDDGSTDLDDKATGETLGSTYKRLVIDFSVGTKTQSPPSPSLGGKADVRFFAGDANGRLRAIGRNVNFDMSAYSGNLQPFARVQKASGADAPVLSLLEVSVEYRLPT